MHLQLFDHHGNRMLSLLVAACCILLSGCKSCDGGVSTTGTPAVPPAYFVLRTTDGGNTWTSKDISRTSFVNAMSSAGPGNYIIVGTKAPGGEEDILTISTDGGSTWRASGATPDVTDISSGTGPEGFAMTAQGSQGFGRTTDYGATWDKVAVNFSPDHINMYGYPAGLATSFHDIYRTADGGLHWNPLPPPGTQGTLMDIDFSNNGPTIVAVDNLGVLFRSDDNGQSWNSETLNQRGFRLTRVSFDDDGTNAVCLDVTGRIYHSDNTGEDWDELTPTTNGLNDIENLTNTIFVVGDAGTLLRSTDKGSSWTKITVPTSRDLLAISFTDDMNGIIVGEY
jgi:photosystem II stability/assembly factor-like uncharacterized protein